MTPARKRNLMKLPLVLLIRLPILLPLWLLIRLGAAAESAYDAIEYKLPGLDREN